MGFSKRLLLRTFTKQSDIRVLNLEMFHPKRIFTAALVIGTAALLLNRAAEEQEAEKTERAASYAAALTDAAKAVAENEGVPVDMSHFSGVKKVYSSPVAAQKDILRYGGLVNPSAQLRTAAACLLATANGETWPDGAPQAYNQGLTAEEIRHNPEAAEKSYTIAGQLCLSAPMLSDTTEATPQTLIVINGLSKD